MKMVRVKNVRDIRSFYKDVLSQGTDGNGSRYPEFELSEFELPGFYCIQKQ